MSHQSISNKRIAIFTGTRAEWGLLFPLASALRAIPGVELQLIVSNMHLSERYGHTVDEIISQGFTPNVLLPLAGASDKSTAVNACRSMSSCIAGMGEALERLCPDMLILLGDRYELLAAASAALVSGVPIVHIAGGETTLGAIDDAIRHAITQMASIHLTQTEAYRQRVISMGANPGAVHNIGSLGVYNILHQQLLPKEEVIERIGLTFDRPTLLVTFHPATADGSEPTAQMQQLLHALDSLPDTDVIFTYPNNDPRGDGLVEMLQSWTDANSHRARAFRSLGMKLYLSSLRCVSAVVGNSSSGIIEVPSMHIPTVDIGSRQQGRIAAESVIHCEPDANAIESAVRWALSPEARTIAADAVNPYYQPDTVELALQAILGE